MGAVSSRAERDDLGFLFCHRKGSTAIWGCGGAESLRLPRRSAPRNDMWGGRASPWHSAVSSRAKRDDLGFQFCHRERSAAIWGCGGAESLRLPRRSAPRN